MHQIVMTIPQFFQAGTVPAEKIAIDRALSKCLSCLKELDSRSSLKKAEGAQVVYSLSNVFQPGSDLGENAAALEPLLESLCDIGLTYRKFHPGKQFLYQSPVYYDRTVVWDSIPALYSRGYGDCKSLTAARVAEYRASKLSAKPVFRFLSPDQNKKGQFQYHILVMATCLDCLGNGCPNCKSCGWIWEDPSKIKGMGMNENSYFQAAS